MRVYYMHTLDNKPATFDGYQVSHARRLGAPNLLCRSLKEIREQQRASAKNREGDGFGARRAKYGHIRVRIPA